MRRLPAEWFAAIIPITLLLVAALLGSSRLPQSASPARANPASLADRWDPSGLLALAALTAGSIAGGNWAQSDALLGLLDNATISPDQLASARQLRGQLLDLASSLRRLQSLNADAATSLDEGRLPRAAADLDTARSTASQAVIQTQQLDEMLKALGPRFGVSSLPATSPLRRYLAQTQALVPRLDQRRQSADNQETALQVSLTGRLTPATGQLEHPSLVVTLPDHPVLMGSQVEVRGKLSSGDTSLAQRLVSLSFGGKEDVSGTTRDDGTYLFRATVPLTYTTSLPVSVLYKPAGADVGRYSPAGVDATLATSFYASTVDAAVPDPVRPGVPITISGAVTDTGGGGAPRALTLLWDGTARASGNGSDTFAIEFVVPADSANGRHELRLVAPPDGPRAGAETIRAVAVARIPTRIQVTSGPVTLVPFALHVQGTATSDQGSLAGSRIRVSLGDTAAFATVGSDGVFEADVRRPLLDWSPGVMPLAAVVEASPPWFESSSAERRVLLLHPASLGLLALLVVALALPLRRRVVVLADNRADRAGPTTPSAVPTLTPSVSLATPGPAVPEVLTIYRRASALLRDALFLPAWPGQTIREFVSMVVDRHWTVGRILRRLGALTERALYAREGVSAEEAESAWDLLTSMRGSLDD